MIQGWFLIIAINSLDTDQVLRNVRLDLDLNCLKLGEHCIYHKGWLIITFISSFVGPDLDLNYLNNSNLDQTHQRGSPLCALRQVTCFVNILFRIPLFKGHCISNENQVIRLASATDQSLRNN